MRGKRLFCEPFKAEARITPADAGKTGRGCAEFRQSGDHPRGCGENRGTLTIAVDVTGSPPRMRGKPHRLQPLRQTRRITPADAGKTYFRTACLNFVKDHPRGCGENRLMVLTVTNARGSPPRMRGKHRRVKSNRLNRGITPADAGKTVNVGQLQFVN